MTDLNELVVFTRVIQTGSFTAAARQLEMPRSTVSRKVAGLEDRIGARLVQRTTRKLGLTDAGRIYFEHGARIVAQLEEADEAVSQLQAAPRGTLRVTAPLSFATLAPVIVEYMKAYPDVSLEVVCTDRTVDLVAEGFDLAIRAGRLSDSSLVAVHLGTSDRVLVASPDYCKAHRGPRRPEELKGHACIVFGAGASPCTWELWAGGKHVEVHVTSRLVVNDFAFMIDAARAGQGIAWLPEFLVAGELRSGRLKRVLPAWRSQRTPVQAVYPTARHLSPKVAAFVEIMRSRFDLRG